MNYETYSQIGQDIFVNNILNEKTNGLFLDVGCCRPEHINNTFLFEKNYNWDGISIDIDDYSKEWQEKRITKFICQDALTVDYQTIISDLLTRNKKDRIDYLTIDLEPPAVTLDVLYKIPFDKFRFSVITFEHDSYRDPNVIRKSIEIFNSYDYKLVASNVNRQEDWWIDFTLDYEWGKIYPGKNYQ